MLTRPVTGMWAGSHHSIDNLTGGWMAYQGQPTTSFAWGVQYRAIYVPIRIPRQVVVLELGYTSNTVGTGDVDVGIYDAEGTRLVSTGSTAKIATASTHAIDVTNTTLQPGLYYLGLSNSTTTDTFSTYSVAAPIPSALGILTETLGSVVLPATASWSVNQTLANIPIVTALLVTEVS